MITSQSITERLCLFSILFADLQATTVTLDFRVTALEENGGGDGNSSIAELEVRVETLEGTTTDHEIRISAAEVDINGNNFLKTNLIYLSFVPIFLHCLNNLSLDLEAVTADLDTRLTASEENIQGMN